MHFSPVKKITKAKQAIGSKVLEMKKKKKPVYSYQTKSHNGAVSPGWYDVHMKI